MSEVPLSDGWTAAPHMENGYVYVEWARTGSQDPLPSIPPMTPDEAWDFAKALFKTAQEET